MASHHASPRPRRLVSLLLAGLAIALVAALGGWALRATLVGSDSVAGDAPAQDVWAEAKQTSIGRALNLSTTVKQQVRVVASNHLPGVVSSVSSGEVKQGDQIYSVAGVGVYAAEGDTPFYEDIKPKSTGENVKQAESFLKSQGHFQGHPDTTFDEGTTRGIKAWQAASGQKADGIIPLGRLVAIAKLPAQVQLAEGISPGKQLAGGEDAVLVASGSRNFTLSLTAEQAAMIPQDSTVNVQADKLTWPALIKSSSSDESGGVILTLVGKNGGAVCERDCDKLPAGTSITLRSQVVVVPATTGVGIPASAVRTGPSGTAQVQTEAGQVDVKVKASGQGMVIVEGLKAGDRVKVLESATEPS
ncbi:peptidoglycan-binding protein [Galactobacter caseinivorans]|uniref:Peptidoglycan-binding protein n=1 Tax=Galactobacter caseinivorans TaxID=2676123 RepID=A0A496PM70_9MICC|nr:peptidoglycan-binding protein [Galactobacter caseinivorans]